MVYKKLVLPLMGLLIIFTFLLNGVFLSHYEGLIVSKIFIFEGF